MLLRDPRLPCVPVLCACQPQVLQLLGEGSFGKVYKGACCRAERYSDR